MVVTTDSVVLGRTGDQASVWRLPEGLSVDLIYPTEEGVQIAGRAEWTNEGTTENLRFSFGVDGSFGAQRFEGARWAEVGMWHNRMVDTGGRLLDLQTTPDGIQVVAYPVLSERTEIVFSILRQGVHDGITREVRDTYSPEGRCLAVVASDQTGLLAVCNRRPTADTFNFAAIELVVDGTRYTAFTGRVGDNVAAVRIYLEPPTTDQARGGVWLVVTTGGTPTTALVEALAADGTILSSESVPLRARRPL